MNKSVCENCVSKRIMVSLQKNPKDVHSYMSDYQNTSLKAENRGKRAKDDFN